MGEIEQYTFEDWKEGKIEQFFQENYYEILNSDHDSVELYLLKNGKLPNEEYEKIIKAKKCAFDLVIKYHKERISKSLSEKLAKAPNSTKYLKFRKETIDLRINEIGREECEKILSREFDIQWFDWQAYRDIVYCDKNNKRQELPGYISFDTGNFVMMPLVEASLLFFESDLIESELIKVDISNNQRDNNSLIESFVDTFSKRTQYSAEAIKIYLTEWEQKRGHSQHRSKAKDSAFEKCTELQTANDGTLSNWERKWIDYRAAQSE